VFTSNTKSKYFELYMVSSSFHMTLIKTITFRPKTGKYLVYFNCTQLVAYEAFHTSEDIDVQYPIVSKVALPF
jgi:hypothetical protein